MPTANAALITYLLVNPFRWHFFISVLEVPLKERQHYAGPPGESFVFDRANM